MIDKARDMMGGLSPTLVARDGHATALDEMDLVLRACRLCMIVALLAGAAIYVVLCVFVILNPEVNPHPALKLAVVTLFPVLLAILLLGSLAADPVVLAATKHGIYYPVRANRNVLVCIRWQAIREMNMRDDGSRELQIKTIFPREVALLKPSHGELDFANGAWSLIFTPGLRMRTAQIMRRLDELKRDGARTGD